MKAIGRTVWVIPGGHIPLRTTGREPAMTSRDELRFLNTGGDAEVEITVFYADRDPVGPYRLTIDAQRVRTVRVNDLIDPLPVPLDTDYALVIRSNAPVVVQFARVDTSASQVALSGTVAFPV